MLSAFLFVCFWLMIENYTIKQTFVMFIAMLCLGWSSLIMGITFHVYKKYLDNEGEDNYRKEIK